MEYGLIFRSALLCFDLVFFFFLSQLTTTRDSVARKTNERLHMVLRYLSLYITEYVEFIELVSTRICMPCVLAHREQ